MFWKTHHPSSPSSLIKSTSAIYHSPRHPGRYRQREKGLLTWGFVTILANQYSCAEVITLIWDQRGTTISWLKINLHLHHAHIGYSMQGFLPRNLHLRLSTIQSEKLSWSFGTLWLQMVWRLENPITQIAVELGVNFWFPSFFYFLSFLSCLEPRFT